MFDADLYIELSLRGLAMVDLMSDTENFRDADDWVDKAMALAATPEEVMELVLGQHYVIGQLMQMLTELTGRSQNDIVNALRSAIIQQAASGFEPPE